jgi:hypothetical protein
MHQPFHPDPTDSFAQHQTNVLTSLTHFLFTRLRRIVQRIFDPKQPIYEWQNGTDHGWFTFDPMTGQGVWGESEAELRLWLREQWSMHHSKGY